MDINDVALNINAARGAGHIRLGFWLNKKSNKTPEEKAAAKAFLKTFWGTLGIVLVFVVILFILTGYVMSGTQAGYDGEYEESRTGRIEDGQVRCVKNELYYVDPETIGLPTGLPEGTHINLYFDENGVVIAGENADELTDVVESRVILTVSAMAAMVLVLIIFAVAARKTFGKPWFQWLQAIKSRKTGKIE